jgi:hypothetical protein
MKTDQDRDVRLTAVRMLGDVTPQDRVGGGRNSLAVAELGHLLHDRVPAVRFESMRSLHKITGKDYGHDINRWLQYMRYLNGEIPSLPAERTFSEKLPTISLPMFK